MKQIITIILSLVIVQNVFAQKDCDCQQELDFVYEQMQDMSSFKSQVRGKKKDEFNSLYRQIRQGLKGQLSQEACFWQLNQLMGFVKDEHAQLYGTRADFGLEDITDPAFVQEYRSTQEFKGFPKAQINLETLKSELCTKALEDIEGIYSIGDELMTIRVYRTGQADSLVGVVLESQLGTWERGQIYLYMKEKEESVYEIMTYSQVHKNLLFYPNRWVHDQAIFSNVRKVGAPRSFTGVDLDASEAYQLRTVNDDIQYVWLNSFSRIGNKQKRDLLIESIKNELQAKHLIIDLRDNGGGASKISKPILKAIRKYSKAEVYVLTNYQSGSNAEQTTIRIKRMFKATHLGERTRGAIAYGMNYGTTYESPSGLFKIVPTDMKFNKWLKYEEVGVQPEVTLDPDTNWLHQTIEIIKAKN